MKAKQVRSAIREAFRRPMALDAIQPVMKYLDEAMRQGQHLDADAILIVAPINSDIMLCMVVGRSALFGEKIQEYLLAYHNSIATAAEGFVQWCAQKVTDSWKRGVEVRFIPLIDKESERWRSFREPLTVDQIKERAMLPSVDGF